MKLPDTDKKDLRNGGSKVALAKVMRTIRSNGGERSSVETKVKEAA